MRHASGSSSGACSGTCRGGGRPAPARTPPCRERSGSRPRRVGGERRSGWVASSSTKRAIRSSRDSRTALCRDAHAPTCASRGRDAKYASDSSGRGPLDRSGHAHLSVELLPQERERRVRVLAQMSRLAALVVRVEHEPTVVEASQQHVSHRRAPVGSGGRDGDRVREMDALGFRVLDPPPELDHRIGGEVIDLEREIRLTAHAQLYVSRPPGPARDVRSGRCTA